MGSSGPGVNKLFLMLPVMFAARKLDGEKPETVFLLRCTYGALQLVILAITVAVYLKAAKLAAGGKDRDRVIFVAPPPTPFQDPNAKKQYTQKTFGGHLKAEALKFLGSTFFGICMTVGLHYWRGMIVGLAIQSAMAPFNMAENKLVRALLMGGGIGDHTADAKIFEEKALEELTPDDDIVDEQGNVIVRRPAVKATGKKGKAGKAKKEQKPFEDILLDTWDLGADADTSQLLSALSKDNVNSKTKESQWTPCMIMAAIGVKDTDQVLSKIKALGGNPAATDEEGWNSLHWAAFHGSPSGAKFLLDGSKGFDGVALGLAGAVDKEGKTPLDHAKAEGNTEIVRMIEEAVASVGGGGGDADGLRKRK